MFRHSHCQKYLPHCEHTATAIATVDDDRKMIKIFMRNTRRQTEDVCFVVWKCDFEQYFLFRFEHVVKEKFRRAIFFLFLFFSAKNFHLLCTTTVSIFMFFFRFHFVSVSRIVVVLLSLLQPLLLLLLFLKPKNIIYVYFNVTVDFSRLFNNNNNNESRFCWYVVCCVLCVTSCDTRCVPFVALM